MADLELAPLAETASDVTTRIEAWLTSTPSRATGIRQAARAFGRSPRSFQRELADLGLTYADIREALRRPEGESGFRNGLMTPEGASL